MRYAFSGFYSGERSLDDALMNSGDIKIIFDTNVLLDLYRMQEETREQFFKLMGMLDEYLWVPYHVALEFQRNRLATIRELKDEVKDARSKLNAPVVEFKKKFEEVKKISFHKRIPEMKEQREKFEHGLDLLVEDYHAALGRWEHQLQEKLASNGDSIRKKLDELLYGKIGDKPSQEWIDKLVAEGKKRFEKDIPPGAEDEGKKGVFTYDDVTYPYSMGDLIVWKQTLDMLTDWNDKYAGIEGISTVVFVTNDQKDDWCFSVKKKGGGKDIKGPRAELRSEICSIDGVDEFFLIDSGRFLEAASAAYDFEIDAEVLTDVRDAAKRDEEVKPYRKVKDIYSDMMQLDEAARDEFLEAYNRGDEDCLTNLANQMQVSEDTSPPKLLHSIPADGSAKKPMSSGEQLFLMGLAGLFLHGLANNKS